MDYPTINAPHYLCGTLANKEQKVKSLIVYTCTSRKARIVCCHCKAWRRQWHLTPVLLPRKSHGWRSLGLQSMVSLRVGHDWVTSLSLFTLMHWRRKWQPTPVFLPGESQGQRTWWAVSMGSHGVGHDWRDLAAAAAQMGLKTITLSEVSHNEKDKSSCACET